MDLQHIRPGHDASRGAQKFGLRSDSLGIFFVPSTAFSSVMMFVPQTKIHWGPRKRLPSQLKIDAEVIRNLPQTVRGRNHPAISIKLRTAHKPAAVGSLFALYCEPLRCFTQVNSGHIDAISALCALNRS